jgi:hypothetical protein
VKLSSDWLLQLQIDGHSESFPGEVNQVISKNAFYSIKSRLNGIILSLTLNIFFFNISRILFGSREHRYQEKHDYLANLRALYSSSDWTQVTSICSQARNKND